MEIAVMLKNIELEILTDLHVMSQLCIQESVLFMQSFCLLPLGGA
jgi:hypothetical protein